MSRILFLHFTRRAAAQLDGPCFEPQLGQLVAVVRQDDHEAALLHIGDFSPVDLVEAFEAHRPEHVVAWIEGASLDAARRTLAEIAESYPVPVVAVGPIATLMPDVTLSLPGMRGVLLGEADDTLPAYLEAVAAGNGAPSIRGLWTNHNGTVERRGGATFVDDLDTLPFADRQVFGYRENASTFDVSIGRGCPAHCAYCPNEALHEAMEAGDQFVRRRSPHDICDELDELCMAYPETSFIRLVDHAFIQDAEWLAEFALVYEYRCGLPFRCHVRANLLDEKRADLLRRAGCTMADVDVISGSDFIRNDVFRMDTSDGDIERAVALLKQSGIQVRAVSFVGGPYSTETAEAKTVKLNRRIEPDLVDIRVYYPMLGTAGRDLCQENGWLSNRCESSFDRGESVLNMPGFNAAAIGRTAREMPDRISGKRASLLGRLLGRLKLLPARLTGDTNGSLSRGTPARVTVPRRRP